MTPLIQWAERHAITPAALTDLMHLMGAGAPEPVIPGGVLHSEAAVQQQVRLAAARRGDMLLFRNNVGACEDSKGRTIRYGIANDSSQMNEQIKSSDLVGITTVVCRCGWRYGVFSAFEAKRPGWHLTPGDKRAQAQLRFGQLVIAKGGIFRFATKPEDIDL